MTFAEPPFDPHVARSLGSEEPSAAVELDNVVVVLTPTRLIVADRQRVRLELPLAELHRVQLTVESDRPGLLTFVPANDRYPADLVAVPRSMFDAAGRIVMAIGRVVAGVGEPRAG